MAAWGLAHRPGPAPAAPQPASADRQREQRGRLDQRDDRWCSAYSVSKAALNALTCLLAGELRRDRILVNAACPGWTATDMGGGGRPVAEGAASVVWAVTLPDDGPTGGFFRDAKPLPWHGRRFTAAGALRIDPMVLDSNNLGQNIWRASGYRRQDNWRRWVKPLQS